MQDRVEEKDIIAGNDLISYSVCPYSFYLQRLEGKSKIPTTGVAAAVLFFLSKRKNIFDVKDKKVGVLFEGQRRAGPLLKHIEQMTSEELLEFMPFSSAEAFGGSLKGTWSMILDRNFYHGNPIYWNFSNESWKIGNDLSKAGKNYCEFVLNEGAPVMGLVDKERTFMFEGVHFRVKIPEIRVKNGKRSGGAPEEYRVMVDHPTLFDFKGELCEKKRLTLEESAAVTLRLYGLSRLLRKYQETYLPKLDAPLWFWDYMDRSDFKILPNLVYRHISLIKDEIEMTTRRDVNLDPLRILIERHIKGVAEEKFDPNVKSCHSCKYSLLGIDGKPVCDYRDKNKIPSVPKHYFNFNNFDIEEKDDEDGIKLIGRVDQKREIIVRNKLETITASHKVGVYNLRFVEGSEIRVESNYDAHVFGAVFSKKKEGTFETQMMERMDELIQEMVNETGKKAVHMIDFNKDFNFAGKKRSKEKLESLGYEDVDDGKFRKVYDVSQNNST
ncbi:MAG: hypothetical protein KAT77_00370 [Nanoarchaeota archaeon]|nr:hypothetical protein [Nanoarchaeota archaeon]